jgi:hypothetical protein
MSRITRDELILEAVKKGYTCNEEGLIYFPPSKKWNTGHCDKTGYYHIGFNLKDSENKSYIKRIATHRLVAYYKFGDKIFDKSLHVRHLNGNPKDNSWNNIAIGTASENMMDKTPEARMKHALNASSKNRKFDDKTMKEIREYYNEVKSYKKTKEKYNISSSGTLHHMLNKEYVTVK